MSAPATPDRRGRTVALVLLCLAEFMVALDFAIMNVMLPSLRRDIDFSDAQLQWVVSVYAVAFGGLLLVGGRAADLLGRRRVLLAGVAGFTIVSAVAATLADPGQLIAARAAQGCCAALITPSALSLLTRLFPDGAERERAMGAWGAVLGAGFVSGVVAGGVITDDLGWSWVFWANVPIGTALVLLIWRFVPRTAADGAGRRLDLVGALLGTGGVVGIMYGLSQAGVDGWGSTASTVAFAAAVVTLGLFVLWESRQAEPLVPPAAIRGRRIAVTCTANALLAGGFFGLLFVLMLFLQQVERFSPLRAGLTFAAAGVAGLAAGILSTAIAQRVGARRALVGGATIQACATAALVTLPQHGTQGLVALAMVVINFSGVVAIVMLNVAAMDRVPADEQGFVGGLLVTFEQLGGALGLALVAAVASSAAAVDVGSLRWGVAVAAGVTLAGALLPLALPRPAAAPAPAGEPVGEAPLELAGGVVA